MSEVGSPFVPPRGLANPHLQSVLASGPLRARYVTQLMAGVAAEHEPMLLDAGDGVRLHGVMSRVTGRPPRALALLLHGWEGSIESNYIRAGAARLLAAGFDVFRLNFRDHGDTHHLNEAIFHSGRIGEVVEAARDLMTRTDTRPLLVAGWSLGGNFALRLALRARRAGLPLVGVAAVCPAIDPGSTMEAMEAGMPLYSRYFEHKWRRSLARKREIFPDKHAFDDQVLRLRLRPLTAYFAERHTEYGSIDDYFDAYSIAGDRLAALPVPADILMAADDPVVPAADFGEIARHRAVHLEMAEHGGHCGFLRNWRMQGYAEDWLAARFIGRLERTGIDAD